MNGVILQPSYIPWRGLFHQIQKADAFVFYDDVQYDKHGWRNRNRIKTPNGSQWLTIPVSKKGNVTQHLMVNDMRICWDTPWNEKHWRAITQSYGKAPYFQRYAAALEQFYMLRTEFLADFTIELTIWLARELGINKTSFLRSSELGLPGGKTDRLVAILQKLGATHYISGPSASDYLEEDKLTAAGITLEYMSYNYPEYRQLYPPFDPQVSILDLLFVAGPEAPKYIWGNCT
jgi:WbqC-like protein family